MKVLVPLAPGFEEIEAVTIIDVLRRAGIDVTSACLESGPVTGSHGIAVSADRRMDEISAGDYDMIVLPGGMPGSDNLMADAGVISAVRAVYEKGGRVAAICAAPIVLSSAGVIGGKKATCFPGFEGMMPGTVCLPDPVVEDGRIITGRGPGCAIPFALKIIEVLKGKAVSSDIKDKLQVYWM